MEAFIKLQMGDDKKLQELFNNFWKARKELAQYLYDTGALLAITFCLPAITFCLPGSSS